MPTLRRDNFVSVHPIGEDVAYWPPRSSLVWSGVYFAPALIDFGDRRPGAFTVDHFPAHGEMTAVMPAPAGMRAYFTAPYGMFWLTDPAQREQGMRGGFMGVPSA